MKQWGLITFAPTQQHLDAIRQNLPKMGALRIQSGRAFLAQNGYTDPVARTVKVLTRAMRMGFKVYWGPMDGPADIDDGLSEFVTLVLLGIHDTEFRDRLSGVIFDAETRDPRYIQQPGVENYLTLVAPAIKAANQMGAITMGPGSTQSDGIDYYKILDALRRLGSAYRIDIPSVHVYPTEGWAKMQNRLHLIKVDIGNLGYPACAITETGTHGYYIRALDGGCFNYHRPSDSYQLDRGAKLKQILEADPFFTHMMWYQVMDDKPSHYGMLNMDWSPKPITTYWR